MKLPESIEQERAIHANKIVKKRFGEGKKQSDAKAYRTLVTGLPTFVRECGLLQMLHFYLAKRKDHHLAVLQDLFDWLKISDQTSFLIGSLPNPKFEDDKNGIYQRFIEEILKLDSATIIQLETEIVAVADWMKRAVEGRWQEMKIEVKDHKAVGHTGNELETKDA